MVKEILEKGYDINEMDALLLEKIENSYLYHIKQNKEIEVLKKESELQKTELADLKTEVKELKALINSGKK